MLIKNTGTRLNKNFHDKFIQSHFIIGLFFVLPIGVDYLLKGQILYGLGCVAISILFLLGAWLCYKKSPWLNTIIWFTVVFFSIFLSFAAKGQGLMILFWCYPTIIGIHFLFPLRQSFIANSFFLALMLPVAWDILEPVVMARFVMTLICVSIFSVFFLYFLQKQQKQLETLALTDSLTGLLNRVTLKENLNHMINQNTRFHSDMTLVSIDLDFFKKINDEFGHDQGDEVLIKVSNYLKQRIRGVDLVFRMGGEEFLILLFDCNTQAGIKVADEIRKEIQNLSPLPSLALTASFGVASLKPQEAQKDWLNRCDQKLYSAKGKGRNQVVA